MSKRKQKSVRFKWRSLIIIIFMGFFTIIIPYSVMSAFNTWAAPYRPPPPPPPIPPPEEDKPPEYPEFKAIPTPCIPNWCFIEATECCFDPVCVMFSDKNAPARCPKPNKDQLSFMNPNASQGLTNKKSILESIIDFFNGKMGK